IPIFLLLNNNSDIAIFHESPVLLNAIDKLFVWNGDSKIFFAMVKHLEDRVNVENDTRIGLVRVILVVEDSAKYYSRYLPMLYTSVMEQTRRNIDDVTTDELYKVLRLRARPKILLASTFEEAMAIYTRYKEFMLCLITDVKYEHHGKLDPEAGFQLVEKIRSEIKDLPVIIQSSDEENSNRAYLLKTTFIDKNSDALLQEIKSFISHYLGFGSFVFKTPEGQEVAIAHTIKEFEKHLKTIPEESLLFHSKRNHFSLWFMARGEVQIAKLINPYRTTDFNSAEEIRTFLVKAIQQYRNEKNKGKVIPFEDSEVLEETNIVSLASGSLGGKGRGVAFINTLIHNFDFTNIVPNIRIRAPKTCIVGTDEFERFLDRNKLAGRILNETNYDKIQKWFFEGNFGDVFVKRMRKVLKNIEKPIAIRSSGLFEDSRLQPFAGIFETYLLPNNHPDFEVRLKQALDAIKLVYASVYSKVARGYVEAIHYKIEEEKMAVVIQEVVGEQYGNYFYPHISGVAQSYNYYPFAHMKPEEGFAVAALGLGKYVVEAEKAYRFSPKYPDTDINSPRDQYLNSQLQFYAVDLGKKDIDLMEGDTAGLARLDIDVAEEHGTLKHLASVYDLQQETISPGITRPGPRIINFANILKYNYAPMAKTIEVVLDVVKEALGSPVEIEFAIDLNRDKTFRSSFYVLQIKPLIGNLSDYTIDTQTIDRSKLVLYSEKGMGNGLIDDVYDLIYVDKEIFDKSMTVEMADEIEILNQKLGAEERKYILIGPGRWGTRDRWIGIPVQWSQISNARIIVETSLEGFPLDASSGSHFFHNVTSMNVGYFSIQEGIGSNFIDWEKLKAMPEVQRTKWFRHIRMKEPFVVKMDGKKRIAIVGQGI
ncbi:MAG TPA: PEP/pyruvate-binding domain-containing protein, partial [Bacteroidales bacterium]|nr:PEP/pyruvate-binding domain-containing protein [Bacteroidales bacterium]